MFQATRRRLAIWYTAVTAVLLLLFASGVYWYVRTTLIERIDDTLNHVVEVVERSLLADANASSLLADANASSLLADANASSLLGNPETGMDTPSLEKATNKQTRKLNFNFVTNFQDNPHTVEDDRIDLEWFSPTGELIWSTFSQPLDIPLHPNRTGETVKITTDDEYATDSSLLLRQVTQRVEIGRQVLGYLRVSHPWFEVTKPSRQLIFDLGLGTSLMVLSVGASGWFLSGKAMEPVGESYERLKQFTADASHELRSPIALIQTNIQVAIADLESAEIEGIIPAKYSNSYSDNLLLVEKLTQRLGKLVSDLLFLARQDNGTSKKNFSDCPIDALLMEVVEEQQLLAATKDISLNLNLIDSSQDLQITPELLESWFSLMGNWEELGRLFTNLIGNALQYTPKGGKVIVELSRIEISNRMSGIRHNRYSCPQLEIKITDTGMGIPPSVLPRLFDRFYRVDPARTHQQTNFGNKNTTTTGSGLGLAIAKAIVDRHQGQIQVKSSLNQGTTFIVNLPCT
ncbi:MAG: HAMP domain-containing sensor histidine kinase [Cyanobacteria bacterium P01_A01_bin.84]